MILIVWLCLRQGYFILLLKSIEEHLRAWKVNLITAPVDPEMAPIWSEKLGFTILSDEEVITSSLLHIPMVHEMMKPFSFFWPTTMFFFISLIVTVLSLYCWPEEINAGSVLPLGDVWEPSLDAKIPCLRKSNLCLFVHYCLKKLAYGVWERPL